MMTRAFAMVLLCVTAACGDGVMLSPTPTLPNISGTWSGTGTSRTGGTPLTIRTVISQGAGESNALLSGTWSMSSADGQSSGSLSGLISTPGAVSLTLSPGDLRLCAFSVTLLASGNRMSGDFASERCAGSQSGSLTLTR